MKRSTLVLIAAGVLIIGAVPLAMAARPEDGHRHRGFERLARLAALRGDLELTGEQVARLRAIAWSVRAENAADREQVRANLRQVATILIADPGAVNEAQAVLARQTAAEQRLKATALEGVSEALQVLTPEQRAKLADHLAKHPPSL